MATDLQLYINLVSTLLGCSVLTTPWGLAGSSVGFGICMIIIALLWNGWTFCILVDAAHKLQMFDMGSILLHTLGRKAEVIFNAVNCIGIILCLAAYHALFADVVTPLMGPDMLDRQGIMVISAIVFYPVCFLDQSRLATLSSMSVLSLFFILGLIVMTVIFEGPVSQDTCWMGYGPGVVVVFSLVNAAVTVQMCIPPIFEDQENREPGRFKRLICAALATVGMINITFGLSGLLAFGVEVQGNVLVALPTRATTTVGRASLLFVAAAGYSMMVYTLLFPIAEAAEEQLRHAFSCWWFAIPAGHPLSCGPADPKLTDSLLVDEKKDILVSAELQQRPRVGSQGQSFLAQAFLRGMLVCLGCSIAIICSDLPTILQLSGNLSIIALMVVGPGLIAHRLFPGIRVYAHIVVGLLTFLVCINVTDNSIADLVCVVGGNVQEQRRVM